MLSLSFDHIHTQARTRYKFIYARIISQMRGTLEVLLVNAEGIRHTNLIGKPAYYVIIQCGTQEYRSKASTGEHDKVWWNQKFKFEFPLSLWRKLNHIKFRIMELQFFTKGGFVGETIVHLGGIITEGSDRGLIEEKAAPYNVVLEDNTYQGQIKIGFRFIAHKALCTRTRESITEDSEPKQWTWRFILNLWKFPWWKFLFYYSREDSKCKQNGN